MCVTCGCGEISKSSHSHKHSSKESTLPHVHDCPQKQTEISVTNERLVQLEEDVLAANDKIAVENRNFFKANHILTLNLVSSPGSGKTSLLCKTIEKLSKTISVGVIEGDQQTFNDAERIQATGVEALQINTGEGCHLEAQMIQQALHHSAVKKDSVLFIENVGNLVCPASFDLGEFCKVVVLSVTEGEDKPLKYPYMFSASKVLLLNKIDLLPYLNFDIQKCIEYAKRVNPDIEVFEVSATTEEGLDQWISWIQRHYSETKE